MIHQGAASGQATCRTTGHDAWHPLRSTKLDQAPIIRIGTSSVFTADSQVCGHRAGFSLMEVLLASAILLGSVIALGELANIGRHHAQQAADLSVAQQFASNKMAEILAGLAPLESTEPAELESTVLDDLSETEQTVAESGELVWWYTVQLEAAGHPSLVAVRVTVWQAADTEDERRNEFSLLRWMPAAYGSESELSEETYSTPADF